MEHFVTKRIREIIEKEGLSVSSFANKTGIPRSTLQSMFDKKTNPGYFTLQKISDAYPSYSLDWLLTGSDPEDEDRSPLEDTTLSTPHPLTGIPLIPFDAIAGFGVQDNTGVTYEQCEHYIVPEFDQRGCEFVIRVSGSSMCPKYSNGDILACKKIKDVLFFQWGKIYVIDSSQGVLVKRVFEDKGNPDNIICVSDNKENYPPFSMPKSDIRSLSVVLGCIRME